MNENPLTESAAYWNKIILGNKSQSEHCNNSAAIQTQTDALFSQSAASKATAKRKKKPNTVCTVTLLMEKYPRACYFILFFFFCRAAVCFACCRFTRFQHEAVCLSCSITIKKGGKKKKSGGDYAHELAHIHTRTPSS